MSSVNQINTKVDLTVRVFDEFYRYETVVPANEYDAVLSFFKEIYGTTIAAENFAVSLFRVSEQSKTPVMTLLQQMEALNKADLNVTMAYYLNGIRSPSTLLGVDIIAAPNPTVARNILL